MYIIFLDIEGVLNVPFAYANGKKYAYKGINPTKGFYTNAVANLNELIHWSGASIVITSTWRYNHTIEQLNNALRERGVYAKVIDKTDVLGLDRGEEIAEWLRKNDIVKKFIIIDDNIQDIKELFPNNYLETDKFRGFGTDKLLEDALEIIL